MALRFWSRSLSHHIGCDSRYYRRREGHDSGAPEQGREPEFRVPSAAREGPRHRALAVCHQDGEDQA